MESDKHDTTRPDAERTVKCAFCQQRLTPTEVVQPSGVCGLCASEIKELGWRTIYDRELKIGQIPANLKATYKL